MAATLVQSLIASIRLLVSNPEVSSHRIIMQAIDRMMESAKEEITVWRRVKIEDEVKTIRKYLAMDCLAKDKTESIMGYTRDILLALDGKNVPTAESAGQAGRSASGPADGLSAALLILKARTKANPEIDFEALYEAVSMAVGKDGKSITKAELAAQLSREYYHDKSNPTGKISSRAAMEEGEKGKAVVKRYLRIRSAGL